MRAYKNTSWQNQNNEGSRVKKISCVIFIIVFFGFFVWFFFFSHFFVIKQIIIEGVSPVDKIEIEKIIRSKITNKNNLFSYPSGKTEKEIKSKYKNIAEIKIYKGPPDALKVIAIERKPMLIWVANGKKYVIDHYGVAYRLANNSDQKLTEVIDERPINVNIGDKILTSNFLKFIEDLNGVFSQKINAKITKIIVKSSVFEILVYTDKDFYLVFDTSGNLEKQINDAKIALNIIGNKPIEYLDLRVPGKVYYK